MSFKSLPTLADLRRAPQAIPKTGKAQRVKDTGAEKKDDEKKLAALRAACFARDKGRCRCCKKRVERSLTPSPKQAQCHHIVGRDQWAVRHDVRNGLTCCLLCHAKIEEHLIVIVGQAADMFEVAGKKYLNANAALEFIRQ